MPAHEHDLRELADEEMSDVMGAKSASQDSKSFWTALGTIFLGPLIGTAIGSAIATTSDDYSEA